MRTLKLLVAGVVPCGVEVLDRTRYQSALELRPREAYPDRDLSEGLEVKDSRGLAHVSRARLRSASANASKRRFLDERRDANGSLGSFGGRPAPARSHRAALPGEGVSQPR